MTADRKKEIVSSFSLHALLMASVIKVLEKIIISFRNGDFSTSLQDMQGNCCCMELNMKNRENLFRNWGLRTKSPLAP